MMKLMPCGRQHMLVSLQYSLNRRNKTDHLTAGILSSIDERTAGKLLDQPSRVPVQGREREFMMTLDVFHQMHCLDVVRQALYRDRYDKHFYFPNGTVDHCKWVHVGECYRTFDLTPVRNLLTRPRSRSLY